MLSYEIKTSFYLCYANTWVDLVPWLGTHHGLDEMSTRFLRFWHQQEQPVEIPSRTPTPNSGQSDSPTAVFVMDSTVDPTMQADPQFEPPVFCGQVLSLHPISAILMRNPAFLEIAGQFFASDEFLVVDRRDPTDQCPAYWNLIGAILDASHEYRLTADQVAASRPAERRRRGGKVIEPVSQPELQSERQILDDYATDHGLRCGGCGGLLRLVQFHHAGRDETFFRADFECRACFRAENFRIERQGFEAWYRTPESA